MANLLSTPLHETTSVKDVPLPTENTAIVIHHLTSHELSCLMRPRITFRVLIPGLKSKNKKPIKPTTTTTYQIAVIEVSSSTKLCVGIISEIRVRILSITTILKIILNNKTKKKLIPYDEICILSGT